jgi:hypothetical protein
VQAGVICYVLYLGTTAVDGFVDKQPLPTGYTAHNIAVLVQTVVRGLAYLLTFIFGANCVGLGALGVQVLLFPDSVQEGAAPRRARDTLPKVSVTSDFADIKRAFKAAEEQGRRGVAAQKKKDAENK